MNRSVETQVVPPGDDDHIEVVWATKERIRRQDGMLKQDRSHFDREYRRERVVLLVEASDRTRVVAFAIIHANGYLSLFGVAPENRREGLGTRLLDLLREEYPTIDCHTRASNPGTVEFYRQAGFTVERRLADYYRDGDTALVLRYEGDGEP